MILPTPMRTVHYDRFGPASVLHIAQVPVPSIGDGDVLVRVRAASLGGGEPIIREGKVALFLGKKFPMSVGVDFAGVVEVVGSRTSGALRPGDHVWGIMPHRTFGAVSDYIAVPEARLSKAPTNITLIQAAALPAVGTTVVRALAKEIGLRRGERLLIRGAGGGVGSCAIQYAKHVGANVVAIAGASVLPWLRELGADKVIDRHTTGLDAIGRFDAILDVVGTEMSALHRLLRPGGRMVELGFDPDHLLRSVLLVAASAVYGSRRIRAFTNNPSQSDIANLTSLVEAGVIAPVIDKVWTMEQIVSAFEAIESGGVRGKHVVEIA